MKAILTVIGRDKPGIIASVSTILAENNISIMTMAPGGFLVFGILIAIVNKISGGKNAKKSFGCAGCPSAEVCNKAACGEKEEAK